MKVNMWMVGWVLMSTCAFAQDGAPTGAEIPAVRKVAIATDEGCGTQRRPSFGVDLPCPSVERVTFEVQTTGLCDVFTTEIDISGGDTYLTIIKQRIHDCTRPEHKPRIEAKSLILADVELSGLVRLGNPILIEKRFRR